MALGDLWSRTLVYFGIAEEDEWDEDIDGYATEEQLERSYSSRPNVRRQLGATGAATLSKAACLRFACVAGKPIAVE